MASRWFYKVFDQEMGPVGFGDLVEMVRTGALTESDPVRRELSEQWTPAREVIGLFRAAREPDAEAKPSGPGPALPSGPGPASPAPEPKADLVEPVVAVPTTGPRDRKSVV